MMLLILGVIGLTVLAGAVGTITGFGTSTIMVPVLLFYLPLPQTLLLVGIIHLFSDLWKVLLFREGVRWKLIAAFGIPGVLFSFFGARIVFAAPAVLLIRLIGVFLIVYTVFLFVRPKFTVRASTATAVTGGALSGFVAGVSGIGGAVRSAFLSVFDLPKSVFIATSGAIGIAVDAARLATYVLDGTRIDVLLLRALPFFILASYIGARGAEKIIGHIPQKKFRAIVALFLLLAGIRFLL